MNITHKFLILLSAGAFLASCSNYGYISENDVYMQAPTEISLDEDENDITSFNSFKARNKGAFEQEYIDPRINERVRMNQIMIISSYGGFGSYRNGPMGFHGMGYYDPFYGYNYRGFNSGIGFGMYGGRGYYSHYGHYTPYGYGYGYNPYFNSGYYGSYYGNGYYNNYGGGYYGGGGYYNNMPHGNNTTSNQNNFYGHRKSTTSSSNRSSYYSKSKSLNGPGSTASYDVNNTKLGTSRRDVQRRNASGSEYSKGFNENGVPSNKAMKPSSSNQINNAPVHRRAVNNSYTPNSSARRSGVVQEPRRSGVTTQPNRGTISPGVASPRQTNPRPSAPMQRTQQAQPQQRSYSSPNSSGSSRGSSSSSPSSTSRRR